ncbi:MAG: EAL domain-containing protein [Gammaproteobacteria bacterium]|nr:EAL domain-containing protein [Gammaproteobacteria bacterium]
MTIYFVTVITLNLVCFLFILLSGIQHKKHHFYSLAIVNLLLVAYHVLSWRFHQAATVSEAITLSRLHTNIIILGWPFIIYTFGHWCRFRYTNLMVLAFATIAAIFSLFNTFSDAVLRHGNNPQLVRFDNLFGEPMSLLVGEPSTFFSLFHAGFIVMAIVLLMFAIRFYKQQNNFTSLALTVCLGLSVATSFLSYQIDSSSVPLFYTGGLPFTLISLAFALMLSVSYRRNVRELDLQLKRQGEFELALRRLATSTAGDDADHFHVEMIATLYQLSPAEFIFVGDVYADDVTKIETRAVLKHGQPWPNFTYQTEGTPSQEVLNRGMHSAKHITAASFNGRETNEAPAFASYTGIPIVNSARENTGLIMMFLSRPDSIDNALQQALQVVSSRAASELQRDQLEQKLRSMAYYDYLSNLPNRARLLEVLNATYLDAIRHRQNVLLVLLDLDHFGEINRKYGYEIGDQVIHILGNRFAAYRSADVFIARNGGDDFAILLTNLQADYTALLNVHWAALKAIVSDEIIIGRRKISVQCSAGAVLFPEQIENRFDVISSAEHALQQAKERGRNQCSLFAPEMLAIKDAARELEEDLSRALQNNDELSMVYQPKVDTYGRLTGSEALLRWHHPLKGFISPAHFIPIAEETGLIHELGKWVLRRVFDQIRDWQQRNVPLYRVSINVTASQFAEGDFIHYLLAQRTDYNIPAQLIEVELTESSLLFDSHKAIEQLKTLQNIGISVALDDFGTGYSSLSYLRDLPLNVLKIDKSFIDNIDHQQSKELVRSIIAIGKHMKLLTVAEGTESKEQVDMLREMGCDYFQGYYFSRPLSAEAFEAYAVG